MRSGARTRLICASAALIGAAGCSRVADIVAVDTEPTANQPAVTAPAGMPVTTVASEPDPAQAPTTEPTAAAQRSDDLVFAVGPMWPSVDPLPNPFARERGIEILRRIIDDKPIPAAWRTGDTVAVAANVTAAFHDTERRRIEVGYLPHLDGSYTLVAHTAPTVLVCAETPCPSIVMEFDAPETPDSPGRLVAIGRGNDTTAPPSPRFHITTGFRHDTSVTETAMYALANTAAWFGGTSTITAWHPDAAPPETMPTLNATHITVEAAQFPGWWLALIRTGRGGHCATDAACPGYRVWMIAADPDGDLTPDVDGSTYLITGIEPLEEVTDETPLAPDGEIVWTGPAIIGEDGA